MSSQLIDKQYEYNRWANIELIKTCQTLTDEQLASTMAGTAGSIRDTLVHLVRAEGFYIMHLSGEYPWPDNFDWDGVSLQQLETMVKDTGMQLLNIASKVDPMKRHDVERPDRKFHFFNYTVVTQALYHGTEHRTQIKMMLTALGVEHPELASWDYTRMETADKS